MRELKMYALLVVLIYTGAFLLLTIINGIECRMVESHTGRQTYYEPLMGCVINTDNGPVPYKNWRVVE